MYFTNNNNLNFNGGYGYGTPMMMRQPLPNATTLLTQDEFNVLANNSSALSLNFSQEDLIRCKCVHRYPNGVMAIDKIPSSTGTERAHCKICGKEFDMINIEDHDLVKSIVENFNNLSESVKTYFMDIPQIMGKFFEYIPITEKLPLVANEAVKSFHKYSNVANNQQMHGGTLRGQYNSIMNGNMGPYAYGVQNQMYPQYNQPMQASPYGMPLQQPVVQGTPYSVGQQFVNQNPYGVQNQMYPQYNQPMQASPYGVSQPQLIPNQGMQQGMPVQGGFVNQPNQGLNPNDVQQKSHLVNGSSVQIDPVTGKPVETNVKL